MVDCSSSLVRYFPLPKLSWNSLDSFLRDSKISNNRGRTAEGIRLVSKFKASILPNWKNWSWQRWSSFQSRDSFIRNMQFSVEKSECTHPRECTHAQCTTYSCLLERVDLVVYFLSNLAILTILLMRCIYGDCYCYTTFTGILAHSTLWLHSMDSPIWSASLFLAPIALA